MIYTKGEDTFFTWGQIKLKRNPWGWIADFDELYRWYNFKNYVTDDS